MISAAPYIVAAFGAGVALASLCHDFARLPGAIRSIRQKLERF